MICMVVIGWVTGLSCTNALTPLERQELKEQIMRARNLKEPSFELLVLAQEALKISSIKEDVIILEGPSDPATAAYHFRKDGQAFVVFNGFSDMPYYNWWFTACHEFGHVFLNHTESTPSWDQKLSLWIGRGAALAGILSPCLLFLSSGALLTRKRGWIGLIAINLMLISIAKVNFTAAAIEHRIVDEKEADLFACRQLIKHDKAEIVKKETVISALGPTAGWLPNIIKTFINYYFVGKEHAIAPEKAHYLYGCLKEYGMELSDNEINDILHKLAESLNQNVT